MRLVPTAVLAVSLVVASARVAHDVASRPAAEASTCLWMSVDDLVDRCDLALEGRVTGRTTVVDASGRIATEYAVTVERTFVGAPQGTRTVRLPGGVLPDGRGLVLPGMPKLDVGETAIVFLARENVHAERVPIGLAQGRLSVRVAADGKRELVSDLRDLEFVDAQGKPVANVPSERRLAYAETVARVEAAAARRAREPRPTPTPRPEKRTERGR